MTPITIEPNSGTKMAGVKVALDHFDKDKFIEILFVGAYDIFGRVPNGVETSWNINDDWYLYEEPKPEVKKVLISPAIYNFQGCPNLTEGLFSDEEAAKNSCVNFLIKWPARVVLKNVYQDVERIEADLYFEVEE